MNLLLVTTDITFKAIISTFAVNCSRHALTCSSSENVLPDVMNDA